MRLTYLSTLALTTLLATAFASPAPADAAAAATTCQQRGTPEDGYCILTTQGYAPAAASYIVSLDYSSPHAGNTLLFGPFEHIRSSLGGIEAASTVTLDGPAGYSLALASYASFVPESERAGWESVLREALSLQTAAAVPAAVTATETEGGQAGGPAPVNSTAVAAGGGAQQTAETTSRLYVSLVITPTTAQTAQTMSVQTTSMMASQSQQQQGGASSIATSTSHAAAARAANAPGDGVFVAVAGACLGAVAGLVFNL